MLRYIFSLQHHGGGGEGGGADGGGAEADGAQAHLVTVRCKKAGLAAGPVLTRNVLSQCSSQVRAGC